MPEGRLTVNGVRWHVKDHLGSVRAVVDGSTGNLLAVTDYDAYGEDAANSTASPYLSPAPSGETFRDRFTGKEDQGPDFGTAYTDFGARQYNPTLRRWLVPDPLSEKYYGVSPYAYCAGNPVNLVDPDGKGPVAGALLGAGLDVGIQITTNLFKGEKWYKIDWKSVAISAGAGAIGAGLVSKVKQAKALIDIGKAAVAATEIMTEAAVSGMESVAKQYVSEGTVSLGQAATDAAFGAAASGAGQVVKNIKRVSPSGQKELKTLERKLNHAERVAGEKPRPSRQANVEKTKAKIENFGNKEQENAKAATTLFLKVIKNSSEDENQIK